VVGEAVGLSVDPAALLVFPADEGDPVPVVDLFDAETVG
jgi:hypothetical protein